MLLEEFDHEAVEQPRLLDLAGVTCAVQDLHLTTRDSRLQSERVGCETSSLPVRMMLGQAIDE